MNKEYCHLHCIFEKIKFFFLAGEQVAGSRKGGVETSERSL